MQVSKKIVISFDGNVYSGKTTLINNLYSFISNSKIITEYSFFIDPSFESLESDYKKRQMKYIEVGKKRKEYLNFESNIFIVDRFFLSMCAHIFSIYQLGLVDLRDWFFDELTFLLDNNFIVFPDVFLFIESNYDIVKKRFELNEKSDFKKETAKYLINKNYFNMINWFNNYFVEKTNAIMLNNDSNYPNFSEVLEKIKLLEHFNKCDVLDIVKEIFNLDSFQHQ